MPSLRTTVSNLSSNFTAFTTITAVVVAVAVGYQPPVDAPVVDPFRAPPAPWAAGNRGIEYATAPGTRVGAAADGTVVFAGMVGGTLHVVVRHADGIRTSYSFLRTLLVHRGDEVVQSGPVGTTGDRVHFGARIGDVYIDPALLFGDAGPPRVHLVPDRDVAAVGVGVGSPEALGSLAALGRRPQPPSRPSSHPVALQRGGKPW
jgi:murein DD-endopeptidase MepM/ murein hydrolase activator NlpD